MKFYSLADTKSPVTLVDAKDAILKGISSDGGLYMPVSIPDLSHQIAAWDETTSLATIAKAVTLPFFSEEIPEDKLAAICESAFPFDTPLRLINGSTALLELFHGPTLAFKDVGARFLARVIPQLTSKSGKKTLVIVATSGDTGGAVADAFYEVIGTQVAVLYPANGVSKVQESQFASLGKNITAIKIKGTFDDCQRIAKELLADETLKQEFNLISANSINIARLIPQTIYYIRAWLIARTYGWTDMAFCVPSGNFGNITAGTIAERLGLTGVSFIAATNSNDTVANFFETGIYQSKPSIATLSNAMDVGNPSNFPRWYTLFSNSLVTLKQSVQTYSVSEEDTISTIKQYFAEHKVALDPHTAVALCAREKYRLNGNSRPVIVLGTAHPVKFREIIERVTGAAVPLPVKIEKNLKRELVNKESQPDASAIKELILS